MPLKLYKTDASPPVRAVLMMAEILKLKYEPVEVNIATGDHVKPEYLEKNPLHSIPMLEDGDFILVDSHAIITYLTTKYGAEKRAELYPNDVNLRATVDQRLFFEASSIFPAIKGMVKGIIGKKEPGASPQQIADANDVYEVLDKYLQKTDYVACDRLTVADVSCVSSITSMALMVPVEAKYEKLNAWLDKLKGEEWYKKANEPGLAQLGGYLDFAIKNNTGRA